MQVSTKETNRNRAMRVSIALEEATRQRMSKVALLESYNRVSEDLYAVPLRVENTRAFFETTISQRKGEIAETSVRRYQQVTKEFLAHLGRAAEAPFRDVTFEQVVAFRAAVAERTSNSNANTYVKCLRSFFTRALEARVITDDPTKRLKPLSKEKRPASEKRRPFTEDEIVRLLKAADQVSEEWKWMIVVGILTGQRLGDIAVMHWSNIEYASADLAVWKFITLKIGRDMVVPLPRAVVEQMVKKLGGGAPGSAVQVFPEAFCRYQAAKRTNALSNQLTKIMVAAGIQAPRDHKAHKEGRNRSRASSRTGFHSLRHTVTSTLSAAGETRAVVMDLVGHKSAEMSGVYTHVELMQKAAAQAKLLAAIRPLAAMIGGRT